MSALTLCLSSLCKINDSLFNLPHIPIHCSPLSLEFRIFSFNQRKYTNGNKRAWTWTYRRSMLAESDLKVLQRFRSQYLQMLPPQDLDIPDDAVIRQAETQLWLFDHLFDRDSLAHLPNDRYQARVLKLLVAKIEESFEDAEEDEVSDDLTSTLALLLASAHRPEAIDVQQKSYVTYSFPPPLIPTTSPSNTNTADTTPRSVVILESRSIISGIGTTGLRTWEAALHLSKYLCLSTSESSDLLKGKNVLELGAGTGLVGILAAKHLGAKHVTITDGDENVVDALRTNIYLNGLEGNETPNDKNQVVPSVLRWGHDLKETTFAIEEPFDVVLGADITYDAALMPSLVRTLIDLMEMNPNVLILISATIRNQDTFDRFLKVCEQREVLVEDVRLPEGVLDQRGSGPFYPLEPEIRIVGVWRRGGDGDGVDG